MWFLENGRSAKMLKVWKPWVTKETSDDQCFSYAKIKNWVTEVNTNPESIITPQTIDSFHDMVWAVRQLDLKLIAEPLQISYRSSQLG